MRLAPSRHSGESLVMKLFPPLLLLALAACATGRSEPVSLVKRPLYQAVGGAPRSALARHTDPREIQRMFREY